MLHAAYPSPIHPKKYKPRLPILEYHADWVAINKPAGMSCHRNRQTPMSQLVVQALLKRQLRRKIFLIHRLDHRTSGCLWVAFSRERAAQLHARLRASTKTYVLAVRGHFGDDTRRVDITIWQHDGFKEALTVFTPLSCHDHVSLLLALPQTGRTHQIRKHAAALGHPILGDTQDGDTKVNRSWRSLGLNRLYLHCLAIDDVVAPLSDELLRVELPQGMWDKARHKNPRLATPWVDTLGGTLGERKDWQQIHAATDP